MSESEKIVRLNTRNASFELLRIIAMIMIIGLHYLSKGGNLPDLHAAEIGSVGVFAYVMEAAFLVAVNVYVLISGFFGWRITDFRWDRVLRLWGTVVFYSVSITLLCIFAGQLAMADMSIYDWMNVVFPVVTEEYWFITAYIILLFLRPFINEGVKRMNERSLRSILIGLLLIFSVAKSVLPMKLPLDDAGYGVIWFLCLYLTGAYLCKYGERILQSWKKCALFYVGGVAAIVGVTFLLRSLYLSRGMLTDFLTYAYTYNHMFCLIAAVGLFGLFWHLTIPQGRASDVICRISGCTLAVYLIHEQIYIRYQWPLWVGSADHVGTWSFLPNLLGACVLVFAVGTVIELVRSSIAERLGRLWGGKKRRTKKENRRR